MFASDMLSGLGLRARLTNIGQGRRRLHRARVEAAAGWPLPPRFRCWNSAACSRVVGQREPIPITR